MNIRKFQDKDAEEVSSLIVTTLRITNIKDYSSSYIENEVKVLQPVKEPLLSNSKTEVLF